MTPESERGLTLAAAGDALVTQPFWDRPDMDAEPLRSQVAGADLGVVNFESIVHDYEGYPRAQTGDVYLRSPPQALEELARLGFDLFATAHNHAGDYTFEGMEATMRAFEKRDMAYAGLGRTLSGARAPAYVETLGGRVGLVAATASYFDDTAAGDPSGEVKGRPGVAPLDVTTRYRVPGSELAKLESLSEALGLESVKERRRDLGFPPPFGGYDGSDEFTLLNAGGEDVVFEEGGDYEVTTVVDEGDLDAMVANVEEAGRNAEWVVGSIHAHQGEGGRNTDRTVPDFLEEAAHVLVEAGADLVLGHGPHMLRGIEIYEGAPIFYSLGNLFFQGTTIDRLPPAAYDQYDLDDKATPADWADAAEYEEDGAPRGFLTDRGFWESVVPICEFDADGCSTIDLYPIELGFDEPRSRRGLPTPAGPDAGRRIIDSLAGLSEPYGTDVEWEEPRGIVRL